MCKTYLRVCPTSRPRCWAFGVVGESHWTGQGNKYSQAFLELCEDEAMLVGLYAGNPLHGESHRLPLAAKPAETVQWGGKKDPR